MADRRFSRSNYEHDTEEYPPFSRLFILCDKSHTETDFRDNFTKYGTIEDLKIVKDRNTGENKGVVYIKYAKTSEAAKALEDMNGKNIGNSSSRPIKVKVASTRQEGPVREDNEEKYVRLFIITPRTMTDSELREEFGAFGKVEYATIVKDKETRESKGYGYVKYKKFSEAASAFENADKKYKAIFAEPKKYKGHEANTFEPYFPMSSQPSLLPHPSPGGEGYLGFNVMCHPMCHQEQIRKLFDIIPGLDYFQFKVDQRRHVAMAQVIYTSHHSAKYAKDKLHGFEYPPGSKLTVKPVFSSNRSSPFGEQPDFPSNNSRKVGFLGDKTPDLAQLAETIAQATSLIQAAAAGTLGSISSNDETFCNVKLPRMRPLASIDAPVVQRCFIVCQPQPPPVTVLRDVFSRFGNLIDVYTLRNKSVGYVKYASAESAQEARRVLHGAEICGIRIKVLEAEEPRSNPHSADSNGSGSTPQDDEMQDSEHDDRRKRLKIESLN